VLKYRRCDEMSALFGKRNWLHSPSNTRRPCSGEALGRGFEKDMPAIVKWLEEYALKR